MARGSLLFIRIDCALLDSNEWKSLTPSARCLYIYLLEYAVKNRTETFPIPKHYVMAGGAGIHPNSINRSLSKLKRIIINSDDDPGLSLIGIKNELITVTHSKRNHAKLKDWHDPYGDYMGKISK